MSKALTPLETAQAFIVGAAPYMGIEEVPLSQAHGRITGQAMRSPMAVPAFDNSMMDGYALNIADWVSADTPMPISARIAAGDHPQTLMPKTVARIFTGAPLPANANVVVPQEWCEDFISPTVSQTFEGLRICIGKAKTGEPYTPKIGDFINVRGQDINVDAVVMAAGQKITAIHLGLLASLGMGRVVVAKRPRVAVITTGSELVSVHEDINLSPAPLPIGKIYNSNGAMLSALITEWGGEVVTTTQIPDTAKATEECLMALSQTHDLLITNGGVSVGEEDHVRRVMEKWGALQGWQLAIKPGKPLAYGAIHQARWVGLPGNPVSAFVTAFLVVRPLILAMQGGENPLAMNAFLARADFDLPKPDPIRREFLRVKRVVKDDEIWLQLSGNQKSAVLSTVANADGLLDNPCGQVIRKGDTCRFIPFATQYY